MELLLDAILYGKSDATRAKVKRTLSRFFRWCGKTPSLVEKQDVDAYLLRVLRDKREEARLLLIYLEQLFRYMGREDMARHCAERRRGIRIRETERRRGYLDEDELRRVVSVLRGMLGSRGRRRREVGALFLLMLNTGIRLGEALRLTANHLGDRVIRVEGKGGKLLYKMVVDDELWGALKRLAATGGRLFTMSPQTARRWFKKVLRMAGLPEERVRALRPHDLRRTAAMLAYKETHDLDAVRVWLGHSKIDTTIIYLGRGIIDVEREKVREISETVADKLRGVAEA